MLWTDYAQKPNRALLVPSFSCWYFGMLSRERTNNILMGQDHSGCFLVRESKTCPGDYVLCVKEDAKVSHYIINRKPSSEGTTRFKIGDKDFADIPSLLNFYKTHYLDTTTLIKPAPRSQLLCKFDFPGRDPEDLPFKRGDILYVISEDEEEWWTARNSLGQVGQIPVGYTQLIENRQTTITSTNYRAPTNQQTRGSSHQPIHEVTPTPQLQTQLPAKAIVQMQRSPNAYDRSQLALKVGDIITVTKMNLNGQWQGSVNGKFGSFPFTHIRFLTPEELQNLEEHGVLPNVH
ncbi:adapter molecule crk-like protein [Plakobranchus ocellatus]|uniref:Adapter molecule crk-like protein n=1 Tax=Plakobranchus ocellatus TaxID=259542 RepID=A0AAV4C658_9GAST|nr:adapter molecule crk-like protein [Plakobranchus ocellatus]